VLAHARFAGVGIDEHRERRNGGQRLARQWLSPRVCPHRGYPPDDFVDEEMIVDRGTP
jgi:hypothetical protein